MAEFYENLKDNLENLGKTISEKAGVVAKKTSEVVDVVGKKTEETIEVQKIKSQIRVLRRNNERDFQDIGKMIYERYQKGEDIDEEFAELCEVIADREEGIASYKESIADIKGLAVCPGCGKHVEPDAEFCPKCGAKLDDDYDDEVFEEETTTEE